MASFFTFFIVTTTLSSIGILLIMLVKKCMKKHISARWHYRLGMLFIVLLSVPLVPSNFFASLNIGHWLNIMRFEREAISSVVATVGERANSVYSAAWLQDYAIPVDRIAPGYLPGYLLMFFIVVWVAGVIASIIIMLHCNRSLRLIKESVKPIDCEVVVSMFLQCKADAGIKGNVLLGSSILVKTPMTVGFFKPLIILPARKIPLNDVRYAMLHELMHCKNKDIPVNSLMCLFHILYWFNPLVYFAFKQMRIDREIACDSSVLEILPKESHISYGETLLNFVKSLSAPSRLTFAAHIGDSKPQIIKRVKNIASYTTESGLLKLKSHCLFFLMALLIFAKIPVISAFASNDDDRFHFQSGNALYADLSYFFEGLDGSFVLYDLETGLYTIHNRDMSVRRVSPNSTYKIFSALIAMESGILDASSTEREWDGTVHPFEAWNQNQTLTSAMHSSASWYFQDFDTLIGIERLSFYLTRLSYGNRNLSGGIADFWMESSLRISPLEQVKLLANFHRSNTMFETEHINALNDALRLSERDGAVLSGKTGTGLVNGNFVNGWFIGYVETDDNMFVFATYIQGEDNAGGSVAAQITLSILESKGIF